MPRISTLRLMVVALSVAAASIAFQGCKDDKNPTSPGGGGGTGADHVINIVANNLANSYSPDPDTVTVGQTVAWKNVDSMEHTATSDASGAFNTGTIAAGATSASITMGTAGKFPYHCGLHPSMTGTLVVKP